MCPSQFKAPTDHTSDVRIIRSSSSSHSSLYSVPPSSNWSPVALLIVYFSVVGSWQWHFSFWACSTRCFGSYSGRCNVPSNRIRMKMWTRPSMLMAAHSDHDCGHWFRWNCCVVATAAALLNCWFSLWAAVRWAWAQARPATYSPPWNHALRPISMIA